VQSRAGWIAATSAELDPGHPEKILMVRRDFAEQRSAEHLALIAALLEACEYCDRPENHEPIAATLARPEYVGAAPAALRHGINSSMDFGNGIVRGVRDFCRFSGGDANEPSGDKAAWALELVRASGQCKDPSAINFAFGKRVFRTDIFEQAIQLRSKHQPQTENETTSEKQTVLV